MHLHTRTETSVKHTKLSNSDVQKLAEVMLRQMFTTFVPPIPYRIYAIPRGGIPAAYALLASHDRTGGWELELTDDPAKAHCFIDDIIDSGATLERYCNNYPGKPFFALIDKTDPKCPFLDSWIVFPWEDNNQDDGIENNIVRLLQYVGEDPSRAGLRETPIRVAKAWQHWTAGYDTDIAALFKTFDDGAERCDEMVVVQGIPFYSHCEHHLAPFFGTATIAYVPNGKILGLSKISRVVTAFARRLQVQERMTNQIADALVEHLHPKGVGVVLSARHLCMESRGIQQQGSTTITSALRGAIRKKKAARAEFLSLALK